MKSHAPLAMLIAVSILLCPSSGVARTATNAERAACESKIQKRIDAIDQRMRQAYLPKDGERLRERRRQLEIARANCRMTGRAKD